MKLAWRVEKAPHRLENFTRARIWCFAECRLARRYVPVEVGEDGLVYGELPVNLPAGVYSMKLIWTKNDCMGVRGECIGRALMQTEERSVFAVTDVEAEATVKYKETLTLRINTVAASYGYDGLDVYEKAVLLGKVTASEEEWIGDIARIEETVSDVSARLRAVEQQTNDKIGRLQLLVFEMSEKLDEHIANAGTNTDMKELRDEIQAIDERVTELGTKTDAINTRVDVLEKKPAAASSMYYGTSDALPTSVPSGTEVKMDGDKTVTSEAGGKYVWVAIPTGHRVVSWVNTLDASEDLVADGRVIMQNVDKYTLLYYYNRYGIGSQYRITIK